MDIYTTYKCRINTSACNREFAATTEIYRQAVDFFISVYLEKADAFSELEGDLHKRVKMEGLTHRTSKNPDPVYDFDTRFYKMPSYYRRAAIAAAIGKGEAYLSSLRNWEEGGRRGRKPGYPRAGNTYPVLYRGNTFTKDGDYAFNIKVFIRNTWDWVHVTVRKSDAKYILRHCGDRKALVPSLQKNGKVWSLAFSFRESAALNTTRVKQQRILAVDLGILSACTCCVMTSAGTVVGREFLHLPAEEDSLTHAYNKLKKAQRNNAGRTPNKWAKVNGINDRIAVLTAQFIIKTAIDYGVHVIVMEHLDLRGKKKGRGKQRLHLWRARYVQSMVETKAHRLGIRVSTVNARGTSSLAYDGTGAVERGSKAGLPSYSLCRFATGKIYNCDLNASYNIGARYFIRELLKSLPVTAEQRLEAKDPSVSRRSTCTLSTLINLRPALTPAAV